MDTQKSSDSPAAHATHDAPAARSFSPTHAEHKASTYPPHMSPHVLRISGAPCVLHTFLLCGDTRAVCVTVLLPTLYENATELLAEIADGLEEFATAEADAWAVYDCDLCGEGEGVGIGEGRGGPSRHRA